MIKYDERKRAYSYEDSDLTDIAWAAGFFEGEGAVRLYLGEFSVSGNINAPQKDKAPLERLQRLFGGSIYSYKQPKGTLSEGNPINRWCLFSHRANAFLQLIRLHVTPGCMKEEIEDYKVVFSTTENLPRVRALARFRVRKAARKGG